MHYDIIPFKCFTNMNLTCSETGDGRCQDRGMRRSAPPSLAYSPNFPALFSRNRFQEARALFAVNAELPVLQLHVHEVTGQAICSMILGHRGASKLIHLYGSSSIVSRTLRLISQESSFIANATWRSKPCGPVMITRTLPQKGSAAIQASCAAFRCFPPAVTAASMCSRLVAGIPLQSNTVRDTSLLSDGELSCSIVYWPRSEDVTSGVVGKLPVEENELPAEKKPPALTGGGSVRTSIWKSTS